MKTPTSIPDLKKSAIPTAMVKEARSYIVQTDTRDKDIDDFKLPTNRQPIFEKYYGKIEAQTGPMRLFAEQICVAFSASAAEDFVEKYLRPKQDEIPTRDILKRFNKKWAEALEAEREVVIAWLRVPYETLGLHGDVTQAEPVQELDRLLYLAKQAAESGEGGMGGVRSAFRELL